MRESSKDRTRMTRHKSRVEHEALVDSLACLTSVEQVCEVNGQHFCTLVFSGCKIDRPSLIRSIQIMTAESRVWESDGRDLREDH